MKIFDIVCTDPLSCHNTIKSKYADAEKVNHIDHNHVVTFSSDYDVSGSLKDKSIHDVVWALGGCKKIDNKGNEVIAKNIVVQAKEIF